MKLKAIVGSALAITLGLGSVAYAGGSDYFPPERINCKTNSVGRLNCSDFNRNYLVEDTYTADFPAGKDVVFNFNSGVAYHTPNESQWTVFFTYKDTHGKNVKLKTVNESIRPDLT